MAILGSYDSSQTIFMFEMIMAIRQELLDELLKEYKSPEDLLGQNGLLVAKQISINLQLKNLQKQLRKKIAYYLLHLNFTMRLKCFDTAKRLTE